MKLERYVMIYEVMYGGSFVVEPKLKT